MARLHFEEKQRFNQWWLWALMGVVLVVSFGPIFWDVAQKSYSGEVIEANNSLMLATIIFLVVVNGGVVWLLLATQLMTRVDEQGVHYRFVPFINKWRLISKREIESFTVGKYNPIKDYGGWGLRYGFKGKAVNVRGNQGIKLHYAGGKKLLIGTQKPQELQLVMEKLMAPKEEY